ncbi:MAG: hypothetical protein II808_01720 [Clostridia bacterium]|nr:hypothetical protein [Clostridia bacterium]
MARDYRPKRRRYLDDFKLNENLKYVYTGNVYIQKGDAKKTTVAVTVASVFMLLSTIGSGVFRSAGMTDCFYVILPYVAEVAALFALLWSSVTVITGKGKLRAYRYERGIKNFPVRAVLYAAFCGIGLLCSILYVILNGFSGMTFETVCYWVMKAAEAAAAILLRGYIASLEWDVVSGETD